MPTHPNHNFVGIGAPAQLRSRNVASEAHPRSRKETRADAQKKTPGPQEAHPQWFSVTAEAHPHTLGQQEAHFLAL
jgi:hypothetical protein